MQSSRSIMSRLFQAQVRRYHGAGGGVKPPTMDDLPVPSGSWQAKHDADQRRYNAALLFGIAFTAATIITAKASGLIYLNYYPPKSID